MSRPIVDTLCGQSGYQSRPGVICPISIVVHQVQLGLNVDSLTDVNGSPLVPLLSRGPPVSLEQPTVLACILIPPPALSTMGK
jgi:hypothetical protein